VLLSRWEFVYIVKWDYPQNLLLRLQAPDYGLDHPAATHAFPSTNTFGTAPNLFPAPRSGALLHSYLVRNGTRDSHSRAPPAIHTQAPLVHRGL
jgi:hypothetical protein